VALEYGMKEFLNRFVHAQTVGYFIIDRNRDTSLASQLTATNNGAHGTR